MGLTSSNSAAVVERKASSRTMILSIFIPLRYGKQAAYSVSGIAVPPTR